MLRELYTRPVQNSVVCSSPVALVKGLGSACSTQLTVAGRMAPPVMSAMLLAGEQLQQCIPSFIGGGVVRVHSSIKEVGNCAAEVQQPPALVMAWHVV